MVGAVEFDEVLIGVYEAGTWMPPVGPGQGAGGGVPAGDDGGAVEVGIAEVVDGFVDHSQGLGEIVAAAAGGA
jgi:hypothetical protein